MTEIEIEDPGSTWHCWTCCIFLSLLASVSYSPRTHRYKVPQIKLLTDTYKVYMQMQMKNNLNLFIAFSLMAEIVCVNSHQNRNKLRMYTADQLCMVSYWSLVSYWCLTCNDLGLVCFRTLDNLKQLMKIHL